MNDASDRTPLADLVAVLEVLEANATPGPWHASAEGVYASSSPVCLTDRVGSSAERGNARLIAAMRNALPRLLMLAKRSPSAPAKSTEEERVTSALREAAQYAEQGDPRRAVLHAEIGLAHARAWLHDVELLEQYRRGRP